LAETALESPNDIEGSLDVFEEIPKCLIELKNKLNEPTKIIYKYISKRNKNWVRFCLIQMEYELLEKTPSSEFGWELSNATVIMDKVYKALKIAASNRVDIICFPELSFSRELAEEISGLYKDIIIIGGSYYHDGYNICPIIVNGCVLDPPYKKCTPSIFETPKATGRGMKSGNIIYVLQTNCGRFSVLTCSDYLFFSELICKHLKENEGIDLDFIVNPCCDPSISRFQEKASSDCDIFAIDVIQVNKAPEGNKYGRSCIIGREHDGIVDLLVNEHFRPESDVRHKLCELGKESILIADLDIAVKGPLASTTPDYEGRIKLTRDKIYEFDGNEWIAVTNQEIKQPSIMPKEIIPSRSYSGTSDRSSKEAGKYCTGEIEIQNSVDNFSKNLEAYLEYIGLPTKDVLVRFDERRRVISNLEDIISKMEIEKRKRAQYISKFVASCAVGLFDAALNYLWNEIITNLKGKIIMLDLDYFYDSIIKNPEERKKYVCESDLENLADWQLIEGCKETGVISYLGYKYLDFIRDMRNFASASHPNQTQLSGYQLVDWLDTCIREVLSREPTGSAFKVKRLLVNIREESFDNSSAKPIREAIDQIEKNLSGSLLKSIFGIYVDAKQDDRVRSNIDLIARSAWERTDETVKFDIGLKYATFSASGDVVKKELTKRFLEVVDGISYLTDDMRAIEIEEILDDLNAAHFASNNFLNEAPHAKILYKYTKDGKIPDSVSYRYVKVLIICRLGNSYGYSFDGAKYYNDLIGKFGDREISNFIGLTTDMDITAMLDAKRESILLEIANILKKKTKDTILENKLNDIIMSTKKEKKAQLCLP